MRIYIACLASYNAGKLYGTWLDLEKLTDISEVQEAIQAMLDDSLKAGAEEWAVHDYDDIPSSFGESPDIAEVLAYCAGVEEHGEAFRAYWEDYECTAEQFEDAYSGTYESPADYAQQEYEDQGIEIPSELVCHVDWEGVARDLDCGSVTFIEVGQECYVFHA